MRQPRAVAAVLLALVLVLTACSAGDDGAKADPTAPRAGGRLPDVRLDALRGGAPLDLRDLRGPAVVNLWASWCGPCKAELPIYAEFASRHAGEVDVVGIDYEETSTEAALELADSSGVTYPLYGDPDGELRAIGLPKVVLVDAQGEIAFEQYVEITDLAQLEGLVRKHLGARL